MEFNEKKDNSKPKINETIKIIEKTKKVEKTKNKLLRIRIENYYI